MYNPANTAQARVPALLRQRRTDPFAPEASESLARPG